MDFTDACIAVGMDYAHAMTVLLLTFAILGFITYCSSPQKERSD